MFQCLPLIGDAEQELGPPPSVDEAANTLMTRLGFLLGEKVSEVQPGDQYSMEVQDENQVNCLPSPVKHGINQPVIPGKMLQGVCICVCSEKKNPNF